MAHHDTGALAEFYRRKVGHLGVKRAIMALARKLLIVAWRILLTGEPYRAARPALVRRKEARLRHWASRAPLWGQMRAMVVAAAPTRAPAQREQRQRIGRGAA